MGATLGLAFYEDVSSTLLDDAVDGGETEPSPPGSLGGEEGLEDVGPRIRVHAAAGVAHHQHHVGARPGVGVVTVLGGGYPASGAPGRDRLPVPHLPEGLRYDPQEGPGEVQTPLLGSPADDLLIGDKVWFRHAKAGELCERFAELRLLEGDRVVATEPTYRGEGKTFL